MVLFYPFLFLVFNVPEADLNMCLLAFLFIVELLGNKELGVFGKVCFRGSAASSKITLVSTGRGQKCWF